MSTPFEIKKIEEPEELNYIVERLHNIFFEGSFQIESLLDLFQKWSRSIVSSDASHVPGVVFLSLWLRRSSLESLLVRELGKSAISGDWLTDGNIRLKAFPVGLVGHWPAANVEILPFLSMVCSLLGGNVALVRIPPVLMRPARLIFNSLIKVDTDGIILNRLSLVTFDKNHRNLHKIMANSVDGAMIWGGKEAIVNIRSLPFPHWARLMCFGPRISIAALDKGAWADLENRKKWSLRLARDLWQFDQQACSSPYVLFVEKSSELDVQNLLNEIANALENENLKHPRIELNASLTSAIVQARADCLLDDSSNQAIFPLTPDWSILIHNKLQFPEAVHGRVLHVVLIDDLLDAVKLLNRNVQTIGLGMSNKTKERLFADLAGKKGIDRIVRLGTMHIFNSPWDGSKIISSMVRWVQHSFLT
ncbi:Acyl-CoA reductase LuxC [Candidatus Magnetomoraceae bacterium gMMP-13]